jgi:hypothetical protein
MHDRVLAPGLLRERERRVAVLRYGIPTDWCVCNQTSLARSLRTQASGNRCFLKNQAIGQSLGSQFGVHSRTAQLQLNLNFMVGAQPLRAAQLRSAVKCSEAQMNRFILHLATDSEPSYKAGGLKW